MAAASAVSPRLARWELGCPCGSTEHGRLRQRRPAGQALQDLATLWCSWHGGYLSRWAGQVRDCWRCSGSVWGEQAVWNSDRGTAAVLRGSDVCAGGNAGIPCRCIILHRTEAIALTGVIAAHADGAFCGLGSAPRIPEDPCQNAWQADRQGGPSSGAQCGDGVAVQRFRSGLVQGS